MFYMPKGQAMNLAIEVISNIKDKNIEEITE
jgi:hypothetical protein